MKAFFVLTPVLVALSQVGCTAEQWYRTGQAWQRNQCNQIRDKAEFDRCMRRTDATYESYERQRESEKSQ